MKNPVLDKLMEYDGKHTAPLKTLAYQMPSDSEHINILINITRYQPSVAQSGATWILKEWCENGKQLSNTQANSLLNLLPELKNAKAVLQVLQMLPGFKISKSIKDKLFIFLQQLLSHSSEMMRWWGYNSLSVLAGQYKEHNEDVKALLRMGFYAEKDSLKKKIILLMKNMDSMVKLH